MNVDLAPSIPSVVSGVGNAVSLAKDPLSFVLRFNDGPPVNPVRIGTSVLYLVNEPSVLHTVLAGSERGFIMGRLITRARVTFGEGIGMNVMTPSGLRLYEPRLAQRRSIQPAFRREYQAGYQRTIAKVIAECTATWRPGEVIDLCVTGREIGFRAAIRALLGDRGPTEPAIASALARLLGGVVWHSLSPDWVRRLPLPANRRYASAMAELDAAVRSCVGEGSSVLLDTLRAARDEQGESLSRQQIRDHLMTILGAGAETVSDTIPWMIYELHRNPEMAGKVRAEIAEVVGGRPLAVVDVASLDYCVRVVHETLRLHSPQWLLSRRSIEPVRLGDTLLPAGATVGYSLYALHRDRRWYPDPTRFDPDRWTPENRASLPRCAFLPFSTGSGRCIGDGFAMAELVLALVALVGDWRLTVKPGFVPRERVGLTVRPDRMPVLCSR